VEIILYQEESSGPARVSHLSSGDALEPNHQVLNWAAYSLWEMQGSHALADEEVADKRKLGNDLERASCRASQKKYTPKNQQVSRGHRTNKASKESARTRPPKPEDPDKRTGELG
jgi:hypothetical protein